MATLNQNSPDILCMEILANAQHECEAILRRAKTEAEALLAGAKTEAEKSRRLQQEQAQAEAARRKELILATVAVETGRLRSARVEALLESIHAEVRRRLGEKNCADRESVVALAAEAIGRMPANNFVVKISPANQAAFGPELAPEITRRTGRSPLNLSICADAALDGGVEIRDAAGHLYWDNRLAARLDRLWPELRRQIALQTSLGCEITFGGQKQGQEQEPGRVIQSSLTGENRPVGGRP